MPDDRPLEERTEVAAGEYPLHLVVDGPRSERGANPVGVLRPGEDDDRDPRARPVQTGDPRGALTVRKAEVRQDDVHVPGCEEIDGFRDRRGPGQAEPARGLGPERELHELGVARLVFDEENVDRSGSHGGRHPPPAPTRWGARRP